MAAMDHVVLLAERIYKRYNKLPTPMVVEIYEGEKAKINYIAGEEADRDPVGYIRFVASLAKRSGALSLVYVISLNIDSELTKKTDRFLTVVFVSSAGYQVKLSKCNKGKIKDYLSPWFIPTQSVVDLLMEGLFDPYKIGTPERSITEREDDGRTDTSDHSSGCDHR